jgi:TPR repeat protein
MLAQNDITAARLIYARLAREGSQEGALTMARTFDPAFLSRYATTGLQPNTEKAKYWYGIAAKLGSSDASKRLLALDGAERR